MKYDFETLVDRSHSGSYKSRYKELNGIPDHIVPLLGAEFEFPTAPHIMETLAKKALTGSYAYTGNDQPEYLEAVVRWMASMRNWKISQEWIVPSCGVLRALCTCIRAFSEPGDKVIIQPPVFGAYRKNILRMDRQILCNDLIRDGSSYRIDFDGLAGLMAENNAKLMVLCNPHNPMGLVWAPGDVECMIGLAKENEVIVFSDEIFADLTNGGRYPTLPAGKAGQATAVTGTSLGKSFGFSGAMHSNIIIADPILRERYTAQRNLDYYDGMDPFMYASILAAYTTQSLDWLHAMEAYVEETVSQVRDFFSANLPEIKICDRHTAYMLWIDWSAWDMEEERLHAYLHKAGLYLDKGSDYGECCGAFTRMVVAAPRRCVWEALERLIILTKKEPVHEKR